MKRAARSLGALMAWTFAVAGTVGAAAPAASAAPGSHPATAAVEDARVTPVPDVSGPLPATDDSYPFGAADRQLVPQDLSREHYVEEEFVVSGTANVYTWPETGPAVVRTPDAPYTTRVLVRRPANGARFSGNVVVEMLNPSNLFDLNIGWAVAHRQMIANGDAWVGITAKPIAVDALQTFDPGRYGALSFANPLPLDDPLNCATVAADSSRLTENGLVWDIYSQVGTWLRSDDASNPLRYRSTESQVERAYGFGYSQTGGYLVNYINAVHPLVVESDGAPVYDAYLVAVAGGGFAGAYPMNQCEPAPPAGDPRRQIHDAGVPVMRIMSQSDYLPGIGSRRPDSDVPGDRYRHYEMAGAGHATPDELYYSAQPADILRADRSVPPMSCDEGPRSRFPSAIFFDAALRNLDLWVREGVAPPRSEPIEVVDGAPVLDRFGNVRGGLRSPYLDVPTSTWYGTATGASFCFIAGYERPFDTATLTELYGNEGVYIRAVRASINELVDERWLTKDDARWLFREATRVDIR
ncbi:alpha/beta hydrolase domain-containing protein [Cellulomonas sp. ATA003]|uniref:alpha/beta hydrolase domain-containing protein n=1 Tax=Cellulomonas sp. ATA003 TaxID=3073064 RepID=UPI002873F0D5|nr:alpha/beta hydrolase domain-containing protein [Cellulomonas sp. ATA003]WNB85503.1 alpha/beta hydrolase domain-containing protein [Cellulomonas sp. ATA003]